MGLLDTIKSVLGFGSDQTTPSHEETDVTVEYEPDTESEAAVKGTDESEPVEEAVAAETDAAASTGSMTEEPPDEPEEAAEPAEAAGPESQVEEPAAGDATPVTDISGIGPAYAERLENAGVHSVEELAEADPEAIAEETDLSPKRVRGWVESAAGTVDGD